LSGVALGSFPVVIEILAIFPLGSFRQNALGAFLGAIDPSRVIMPA